MTPTRSKTRIVPDAAKRNADGHAGGKSGRLSGEKLICAIHDYAWNTYGRRIEEMRSQCPYNLDFDNEVYVRRQLVTWFASTWINPDTGETAADEFVKANVQDSSAAARILQVKELIHDEFRAVDTSRSYYKVVASKDGTIYKLLMVGDSSYVARAEWFEGQIFPWYPSDLYRTCGVVTATMGTAMSELFYRRSFSAHVEDREHLDMIDTVQKAESAYIKPRFNMRTRFKTLPTEWIYQMYTTLGFPDMYKNRGVKADAIVSALSGSRLQHILEGLSPEETKCLMSVVDSDGYADYEDVQGRFGPDDKEVRWSKSRPLSAIGGLRRRGILWVGRDKQDRKMLVIQSDVLANIQSIWHRNA